MLLLVFVEATHGNSGVCDSHEKKRQKKVNSTSEVFHSGREGHMLKVQFSSVAQSCLTLCDAMGCSLPGHPVYHQLPEFSRTHVH